jgi:hypothetical protein
MLLGAASAVREGTDVDVLTVIGVIAGAVGAIGAVIAAVYSVLTWRQGKRNQQVADDRYLRDIVPRPRLQTMRPSGESSSEYIAEIINSGGAAVTSLFLVQSGHDIFIGGRTLPAQGTAGMQLKYRATIEGEAIANARAVLIAAKDVQDIWWNCMLGVRIEDLQAWWAAQLESLGIPHIPLKASSDGLTVTIGPSK